MGRLVLRSSAVVASGGGASGVFFNPDIGLLSNGNTLVSSGTFVDVNRANSGDAEVQSTVTRPGGQSKCVLVTYVMDESQATLKPASFPLTTTLFTRKHEMYTGGWEGNWPVGLKTSRYFSRADWTSGTDAYMSEKFIWQKYPPPADDGDPNALYVWGLNHALGNNDRVVQYSSGTNFANGLPYLREGYWYKFETWMVMDSGIDAGDGILKCWIDDQVVIDQVVSWRSTANGSGGGDAGFQSMWFGGNISSADNGYPTGVTLNRYIDSPYLSTTLDR